MLYHRIFYNSIYEYYARKSKIHDIPYNMILFFHARNMLYHRMIYIHIFLFHARTTVIHHMARSNLYVSHANNNDFPHNHGILTLCDHEYIALTLYSLTTIFYAPMCTAAICAPIFSFCVLTSYDTTTSRWV